MIKLKIKEKNRNDLLEKIKKYKKIDINNCMNEDPDLKMYFKTLNVPDSRMRFKIASFMVPTIRMNFKSNKRFAAESWSCSGCRDPRDPVRLGVKDTQEHVMRCEAYSDLRVDKDVESDYDLVHYFRQVIARRTEVEH